MKFLELNGYGNNFKHLISIKSISDIAFEPNYTHIVLSNSTSVNVVETKEEIIKMIYHLEGFITNKDIASIYESQFTQHTGDDAWDVSTHDDELPF
jgi:hypothetical protein